MLHKLAFLPEQASTLARDVDTLAWFLTAVCALLALLIAVVLGALLLRHRRRHADQTGEAVAASPALEIAWTLLPLGLVLVIFVWGSVVYVKIRRPPPDALEILVVGKQWMWKAQHLEGRREINELHVPTGQPVKLRITSEDVIHSFSIPAFRVKADAVPGRFAELWFVATRPGTYHLFCAEYCGTEHAKMRGRVIAMDPAAYQAWLGGGAGPVPVAAAEEPSPQEAGAALFEELGCVGCHREGQTLGPVLKGVYGHEVKLKGGQVVVADEDYLRESILDPQAKIVEGFLPVMPPFKGRVSEEQLHQLIEYIKSLSGSGETASAGK